MFASLIVPVAANGRAFVFITAKTSREGFDCVGPENDQGETFSSLG